MLQSVAIMLDAFNAVINGGFQRIHPTAVGLASAMIVLGLMFSMFGAMFHRATLMGTGLKVTIVSAFYLVAIDHVQDIGEGITRAAVQLGLTASGSNMNIDNFLAAGGLVETGFTKMLLLNQLAADSCATSSWGCVGNLQGYLPAAAGAWIIFGVFALVALLIVSASLLFKLSFLAGMILLPFALIPPTANFGWMPIKAAFHCGTQLMMLAVITGVGNLAMTKMDVGIDPGLNSTLPVLFGAMLFGGLVLGASYLTAILTSGALVQAGALFGVPAGMAAAGARSAAGHIDQPATKAMSWSADKAMNAMKAAATRSTPTNKT